MIIDEETVKKDLREHLSERRFRHSVEVALSAKRLAEKYGADPERAYAAGLLHDILKEQEKEEALAYFSGHGCSLTELERHAPKLWHAIAGSIYAEEKYGLDRELVSAIRYHTTGKETMTLLEKILFIADFISADRDYPGVDEMRKRAEVSLEYAMEEGLRFTVNELSEACRPIHPDTVSCYNAIILRKEEQNG